MLFKRTIELEADIEKKNGRQFEVGDVIAFALTNGEEVEAMAMKAEEDGMIFALVDCIEDEQPMMKDGKLWMREYLNRDLYIRFPVEIRNMMLPFEHADMLRLLTQKEVFGENIWESDIDEEEYEWLEPMKDRRNRIAFQGKDSSVDDWCWYWLADQRRDVASGTSFASVDSSGDSSYSYASNTRGVRPAFKLSLI